MDRRAQVELLQRNEISALRAFLTGDPRVARRYGTGVPRRRGVGTYTGRLVSAP